MAPAINRLIFITALLAFATSAHADITSEWTEKGWTVLFEAKGDLNGDKDADHVAVVEAPQGETTPENSCDGADDYSDAATRRLIIAFDDGGGGQAISADEPRVVLRRDQGGVFGDPLEDLAIENGAVVIRHYGGSRWRWGNTLRFRYDDSDWRLIGMTEFWLDSLSGSNVEYDYNPLTGKMARTVEINEELDGEPVCAACRTSENCPEKNGCYAGTRPAKPGTEWFDIGAKPAIPLAGFTCWQEETGLLKHLGFQSER